MWCVNLTLTKASILTLYTKIFTMRPFVIVAKTTIVVTAFWYVLEPVHSLFELGNVALTHGDSAPSL